MQSFVSISRAHSWESIHVQTQAENTNSLLSQQAPICCVSQPNSDWLCSLLFRSRPIPLPSDEGVQFTNPAQNYSPLTEALQCDRIPMFIARGINTRYADLTNRYLLVNDLCLHINVSLNNRRLLLALCHPGEFLELAWQSLEGNNWPTLQLPIPSWH